MQDALERTGNSHYKRQWHSCRHKAQMHLMVLHHCIMMPSCRHVATALGFMT